MIATGQTPEQLQKRLDALLEAITFQVFNYARRGLFDRHKLILSSQLTIKVLQKAGKLPDAEVAFLLSMPTKGGVPAMSNQVASFLGEAQWAAMHALGVVVEASKGIIEDFEARLDEWKEWIDMQSPEEEGSLPGDWEGKLTAFQRLLLLRALRPDRVTTALALWVKGQLGARFVEQEPFSMKDTFADSSAPTPLFFVLFPGVDPGSDIEKLGVDMGFTLANGRYVSISMGQGQEAHAEASLDKAAKEGGWVFLQNVHLMQSWLPTLERRLEIAAESGHDDFRCFLSAEPPPLPDQQTVPEGILQAAIKVANEPPADLKANLRMAFALFNQNTFDASSKKEAHRPMLFALCFFHALSLGRRKFGFQGFSRSYPFNNGDLNVCASVLHNYLEANAEVPWDDLRYNFGEIMYGGHITDFWDRRITNTYLDVLMKPALLESGSAFVLAPEYKPLREGEYDAFKNYVDQLPPEDPRLFGMHPNSQIALLQQDAATLFAALRTISGGGGGAAAGGAAAGGGKEQRAGRMLEDLKAKLPEPFLMIEIKAKAGDKVGPYQVCALQELERANMILREMRRALDELELGLTGALNISDLMDTLITNLAGNDVPNTWLKICGQVGPTGNYNRKPLGAWFADLLLRVKQLKEWVDNTLAPPPSVWIAGLFNPMGYVTACLQVTARAKGLPLDTMEVHTEMTAFEPAQVNTQPSEGTYVHGLFMEGARWDREAGMLGESLPKELHPPMPVMHIKGVTEDMRVTQGVYTCPVYTTTIRGPTFTFSAPLKTDRPSDFWVLAGVCLVMQPDS